MIPITTRSSTSVNPARHLRPMRGRAGVGRAGGRVGNGDMGRLGLGTGDEDVIGRQPVPPLGGSRTTAHSARRAKRDGLRARPADPRASAGIVAKQRRTTSRSDMPRAATIGATDADSYPLLLCEQKPSSDLKDQRRHRRPARLYTRCPGDDRLDWRSCRAARPPAPPSTQPMLGGRRTRHSRETPRRCRRRRTALAGRWKSTARRPIRRAWLARSSPTIDACHPDANTEDGGGPQPAGVAAGNPGANNRAT